LLEQWIANLDITSSSPHGAKVDGSPRADPFYLIDMLKYTEKKISLVGWGDYQVMLHTVNGHTGLSVVENNRLVKFGLTPWLQGLIAVVPTTALYCHGREPLGDCADLIMQMRSNAFQDALQAINEQNIPLLAEAVMTTYMAQQHMGAELLPNRGEIAKRFSGKFGVYVFREPHAVGANLKSKSVMFA
jgi:hypothetical protein